MSGIAQKKMTNKELAAIAETVAKKHGYQEAAASFMVNRDLKLRWTRSYTWISLELADYLAVLDAETIAAILEETFRRIEGKSMDTTAYENAVMSKEFKDANRATYIARSHAVETEPAGVPDVQASYERLCRRGMLKRDPELTFCWSIGSNKRLVAQISTAFKTVVFSDRLAYKPFSDGDIDFLVYSTVTHATKKTLSPDDTQRAKELVDSYPDAMAHRRAFEALDFLAY